MTADVSGAGVGFIGEVAALGIEYSGDVNGAPTRMVAKFPSQSPEIRAMLQPIRVYEREHRFYRDLADETPIGTPAVYHVTCDADGAAEDERYMLLMQDLSHLELGDQVTGTSVEQTRIALAGLAGHHARFWNGAGLENADFIPVINGPLNQAGSAIYEASLPGFMEAFGEVIAPELADFVSGYAAMRPAILDEIAAMPHTLAHFDYRADNLFFGPDGNVVVIDWQTISRGGGAADLGYLLSQNLTIDDRKAHETELLQGYHDALVEAGVTDYSFERLLIDYTAGISCGWMIPVLAVGSLDFSSERAVTLWTAVIERAQSALIDHGFGS